MILLYEIDKLPGWPALQTAIAMKQETYRLVQPGEYHLSTQPPTARLTALILVSSPQAKKQAPAFPLHP